MNQKTIIGILTIMIFATLMVMYVNGTQPPELLLIIAGIVIREVFGIDVDTIATASVAKANAQPSLVKPQAAQAASASGAGEGVLPINR